MDDILIHPGRLTLCNITERENNNCCTMLDKLGFCNRVVSRRIRCNNKLAKAMVMTGQKIFHDMNVEVIFVGSTREGAALSGASDTDLLHILNDVLCIESKVDEPDKPILFRMEAENEPAGYSLLQLDAKCHNTDLINWALETRGDKQYLSSRKFMNENNSLFRRTDGWLERSVRYKGKKGPSLPETLKGTTFYDKFFQTFFGHLTKNINIERDSVRALQCCCPSVLEEWRNRPRKHGWPTPEMTSETSDLPCYLVPVGHKGIELENTTSMMEDLQWRLCFNEAEIKLIQSFTNTQMKTFVLLRHTVKTKFRPHCPEMTSFVVKNVMFWLLESSPSELFCAENLLQCVFKGLELLKAHIATGHVPCYMIRERNLISNMSSEERNMALEILDNLLTTDFGQQCEHLLTLLLQQSQQHISYDRCKTKLFLEMSPEQISDLSIKNHRCSSSLKIHWNNIKGMLLPYVLRHRHLGLQSEQDNEQDGDPSSSPSLISLIGNVFRKIGNVIKDALFINPAYSRHSSLHSGLQPTYFCYLCVWGICSIFCYYTL